jgi:hypothetical protein
MIIEPKKIYLKCRYPNFEKIILSELAKNIGIKWQVVRNLKEAEIILCFDSIFDIKKVSNQKNVLVRFEPYTALPEVYDFELWQAPDLIIDVGRQSINSHVSLQPPQELKVNFIKNTERILNKTVMINSNLFSLYKNELYSLRKNAILKCFYIDLFGRGWNKSLVKKIRTVIVELQKNYDQKEIKLSKIANFLKPNSNYFGEIKSKSDILVKYNTSLIIENENTYVSEKLFDCLCAGTIPIYVGGDLSSYKFPTELILISEPDLDSINICFDNSKKIERKIWEEKLLSYLNDEQFVNYWSFGKFLEGIDNALNYFYQ